MDTGPHTGAIAVWTATHGGQAGAVEHLQITGLPRLGDTHASVSQGQIHLAPVETSVASLWGR